MHWRCRFEVCKRFACKGERAPREEPFGALDPETRWQMQSLLLEIVRKERTTVLLVSHDIEEALYLGDVVFFPAGEQHWHGASPDTAMSHIAIQESIDGSPVTWMEKVSDEDYQG